MAAEPDDLDRKLAFAVGCGMTVDEAVEVAGVSRSSYYSRSNTHADLYGAWIAFGEMVAAKTVALRIGAAKAVEKHEDRIVSRLDGALKITDKVIRELTSDDDRGRCTECRRLTPQTIKELIAGHRAITTWAAKYAASEMPKRIQHSGAFLHGHVALQDDTVAGLAALQEHMLGIPTLLPALPAAPEGAITVEGTNVP